MSQRIVLGIHIGHDRGAALVKDGVLIAQMAEERLDRRKHSPSPELPARSIASVLDIAGIRVDQVAAVGVSYTNVVIGDILAQLAPEIQEQLNSRSVPVYGIGHHDCHAWSSYFMSGLDRSLVVVADGAGDLVGTHLEAESIYVGDGPRLSLVGRRLQDPGSTRSDRRNAFNLAYMSAEDRAKQISLGRKYEQFTYLVGFGHGQAGKTMALAAYAEPLFIPEIPEFTNLDFSLRFDDGLQEIDRLWKASGMPWHRFIHKNAAAIAASGQAMIEGYMARLLATLASDHVERHLCGAGGLFLSCRMNSLILTRSAFTRLFVVPAAGDDGQCIGAALAAYALTFEPPRRTSASLPYLGPSYSRAEIEERLSHFHLEAEWLSDSVLAERVAEAISSGLVIGILRGRSELGPRALCHRSLLADPRRGSMKDRLNILKSRERFRPFAPVVIAEAQFEYFDLPQESPFMLLAAPVHQEFREALPAITHVDGSARVQAVHSDAEPFTHALLTAFAANTGFPILVNTSFNIGGDPIVESPHDAIATFLSSDIDALVLENFYLEKPLRKRDAESR